MENWLKLEAKYFKFEHKIIYVLLHKLTIQ